MPYPRSPTRTYWRSQRPSHLLWVPTPPRNLVMPLDRGSYTLAGKGHALNYGDGITIPWVDSNTPSLLNNLVSYWKLDETSGTRFDSYGSNHLADNNTVTSVTGKQGNAAEFVRANLEYLSCNSNSTLQMSSTSFTICAWVKVTSLPAFTDYSLVTKDYGGGRDYTLDMQGTTNGFRFYINGGGAGASLAQVGSLPTVNQWYFLVAWFDISNGQLHLRVDDTTTYDSGTGGTTPVTIAPFAIGARFYSGAEDYSNSQIDEVGIWKRVLTANEITTLYNSGFGHTHPFRRDATPIGVPTFYSNGIYFGTNNYFQLANPIYTYIWTVIVAMIRINQTGIAMSGTTGSPVPEAMAFSGASVCYLSSSGNRANSSTALPYNVWQICTATSDGAAGYTMFLDGATQTLAGGGAWAVSDKFDLIGARGDFGVDMAGCYIAEVMIFNTVLNSTDRANAEAGVALRTGLTVAGGTPVDPNTIAGLQGWWKADTLALGGIKMAKSKAMPFAQGTYALISPTGINDGDPVSTWIDNSGNGHHATQTGTARPIYKVNGINSRPVVRFDAASLQFLSITSPFTGAAPWTIFHVMKATSPAQFMPGLAMTGAGATAVPEDNTFGPYQHLGGFYLAAGTMWQAASPANFTGFRIYAGTVTSAIAATLHIDGTADAVGILASGVAAGVFDNIGRRNTQYATGDMAEVIAYNVVLSSIDRANIEKGLADKYGITVAGGTAVDPASVSGLVGWWKADAIVGTAGTRFGRSYKSALDQGAYSLTGQATKTLFGHRLPVDSGGAVYTDDFNRANGGLGANWTTDSLLSALSIVSNACKGGFASQHNVSVYNASGILAANQYAQCKVTAIGGYLGLVLRSDGAGSFFVCFYQPTTANVTLYRCVAGSYGGFATGSVVTPTVGDVVYFEAVGNQLTMKVNGVVVCTATDSTYTGAGYTGIDIYDNVAAVDDFEAGAIGAAGPTFTLTGKPVGFPRGKNMPLVQGAYALTGQLLTFKRTRIMPLVQGAYNLAGQAVTLTRVSPKIIAIVQGAFTLTGQAVNFPRGRIMPLVKGQYNLTGQVLLWKRTYIIPLVKGNYAWNGQAMNFVRGRIMSISQGAITLTGIPVTYLRSRVMPLIKGQYNLTGQTVNFLRSRIMSLVQGAYNLAGGALGFLRGRGMQAPQGAYSLAGQALGFLRSRIVPLIKGNYALSGQPIALVKASRIVLTAGGFTIAGQPVSVKTAKRLVTPQGFYALSGNPVFLLRTRLLTIVKGDYTLTGQPLLTKIGRIVQPFNGLYFLSGQAVMFIYSGGEFWKFYAGQVTQSSLKVNTTASALKVSGTASTLVATPSVTASSLVATPTLTASALKVSIASSALKVEKTD